MFAEARAVRRQNLRGHFQRHESKGQESDFGHCPSCSIRKHRKPLLVDPRNKNCVGDVNRAINTCKSVSKQMTLSPFRINTGSVDILPDEGMPQAIEVVGKTEQQGLANLYR